MKPHWGGMPLYRGQTQGEMTVEQGQRQPAEI
jgi:hypothetical protein